MNMTACKTRLSIIVILCAISIVSCTTIERDVQTPTGPQAEVDGPLHVLRVLRRMTTTGNQADASDIVEEAVLVNCPANTLSVVPVIEQVAYGQGEIDPDDLSMVDPATGLLTFSWTLRRERPLGMVLTGVSVTDIDAPGPGGEQRVTLAVRAFLSDENFDDPWWWAVQYKVLCLGTPV